MKPGWKTIPEAVEWVRGHPRAVFSIAKRFGFTHYTFYAARRILGLYQRNSKRGAIVEEYIRANPGATIRAIARATGASHGTICAVQARMRLASLAAPPASKAAPGRPKTKRNGAAPAPSAPALPPASLPVPTVRTANVVALGEPMASVLEILGFLGVIEFHFKDGEATATVRRHTRIDPS